MKSRLPNYTKRLLSTDLRPLSFTRYSHIMIAQNNTADASMSGRYRMPVESARHACTLMAFPSIASADNEDHLKQMQSEIVSIANAIAKFEPVHLYTRPELVTKAEKLVQANVFVETASADQLWIRDSGPVFVEDLSDASLAAIDFGFNYWGSKLPQTGDEDVARQVAEQEKVPSVKSRLVLEGGAIEHDGEGTFLGAESCIVNGNRNSDMTKAEIEAELNSMLGVSHFIWIPGVKGYDITDDHIDALARFIEPGVVLLSKPPPNAPDFVIAAYNEAKAIISDSKDAKGRSIQVYDCEEPEASTIGAPDEANEVVASYANYYLVNGAVMIAKFGQEEFDNKARDLFSKLFPSREIVQVHLNMLPRAGGGIHCATQQIPNVSSSSYFRKGM